METREMHSRLSGTPQVKFVAASRINAVVALIDGVVELLPPATSEEIRVKLREFRRRAITARGARSIRRCDIDLESYLHSTTLLRAAAEEYLAPKLLVTTRKANDALALVQGALSRVCDDRSRHADTDE